MERITVYQYDSPNILRHDPAGYLERATPPSWTHEKGKGFAGCTFDVPVDSVFGPWPFQEKDHIVIRDGSPIVYDGYIMKFTPVFSPQGVLRRFHCVGWWSRLVDYKMTAIWVDTGAVAHLQPPASLINGDPQKYFEVKARANALEIKGARGTTGVNYAAIEYYREDYIMPSQQKAKSFAMSYTGRTGEGFNLKWWPEASSAYEITTNRVGGSTPEFDGAYGDTDLITPSRKTQLHLVMDSEFTDPDGYNVDDWCKIFDMTVKAQYVDANPYQGSETYAAFHMIIDTLFMAAGGNQLSADTDQIVGPTTVRGGAGVQKGHTSQ